MVEVVEATEYDGGGATYDFVTVVDLTEFSGETESSLSGSWDATGELILDIKEVCEEERDSYDYLFISWFSV